MFYFLSLGGVRDEFSPTSGRVSGISGVWSNPEEAVIVSWCSADRSNAEEKAKTRWGLRFWRACRRQLVQSQEDLCYYRRRLIWPGYTCDGAILSESESLTPIEHKAKKNCHSSCVFLIGWEDLYVDNFFLATFTVTWQTGRFVYTGCASENGKLFWHQITPW